MRAIAIHRVSVCVPFFCFSRSHKWFRSLVQIKPFAHVCVCLYVNCLCKMSDKNRAQQLQVDFNAREQERNRFKIERSKHVKANLRSIFYA